MKDNVSFVVFVSGCCITRLSVSVLLEKLLLLQCHSHAVETLVVLACACQLIAPHTDVCALIATTLVLEGV